MKKLVFLLVLIQLFFSVVLYAQNITVVTPPKGTLQITPEIIKNVVQKNYRHLRLNNNIIKIYYTEDSENFIIVKLSRFTYSVSFMLIKSDGNFLTVQDSNYIPHVSDFKLYTQNNNLQKILIDNNFLFDTPIDSIQTCADAINTAADYATNQNYSVIERIGSSANISYIQSAINGNNLIAMGNVGHGNPNGILLSDGFLDYSWFGAQNLSNKIFFFNSCETFNDPLKSSILNDGNARTFAGGILELPIGTSEVVFIDFWNYTLNNGWTMYDALDQAAANHNFTGDYGIAGDLGIMNLTTSGTLRGNEIWSGNISITGNVTVPAGIILTIKSGTNLTFNNGISLIVNGTLNAIGTSTNPITFNRSGTGTWGGIHFNNGSSGNLQYCTIQNATYGVFCNNSSPTIDHCTISYNGYGIYGDYYGSPQMSNNLIEYCSYGVWCNSGSSPNLATSSASQNVIRKNTNDGVYAIYGSNPTLGVTSLGGNSIYGNGTPTIRAIYSSNISAINNWWGAYPPSSSLFYTYYGTITYTPALSSNPNYSILVNSDTTILGTKLGKIANLFLGDLDLALNKQIEKKYDEAIPLFLEVFKNNKDSLLGKYALSKIEECFTQAGKKDFLEYSKKELRPLIKSSSETFVVILELETHQLVNAGLYEEAMDNLFLIKDKYNLNEEINKNTLYRIGVFYSDLYGDKKNAEKYFDELKAKYPTDDLVNNIDRWLNSTSGESKYGSYIPAAQIGGEISSPKDASIAIDNYPNPFNPTTKINFTIPEKGNVKLKVFDVLGREISILADGVYEAGKYEVSFSASNLPSGIYFCNLISGNNSITKKMLLVK